MALLAAAGPRGIPRWRHAQRPLQLAALLLALAVMADGWFGSQAAPANLAGVLPWAQLRGLLVLPLLLVGNVVCFACPFTLPRRLLGRWLPGGRAWPRHLRGAWLATALLLAFFWAYEAFNLWDSPLLTAWLVLAYFVGAFTVDSLFAGDAFCQYVCPLGAFSRANLLTVETLSPGVGRGLAPRRWQLKLPHVSRARLAGGDKPRPYTTLPYRAHASVRASAHCADCHATAETQTGDAISWDAAALALVVTACAYLSVGSMALPVYPLEAAIGGWLRTSAKPPVILVLFIAALLLFGAIVSGAAWVGRALSGGRAPLARVAARGGRVLAPSGFSVWLAHFGVFHFLAGALSFVSVFQHAAAEVGLPMFGSPMWQLGPIVPVAWLLPLELLCLEAGWLGSLLMARHVVVREVDETRRAWFAMLPWAALSTLLFALGVWLFLQPLGPRGSFLSPL